MLSERLLIVGGTGFIGSNLLLKSLEEGYSVTILSLNIISENLKINNVKYVHCDIRCFEDLKKNLINCSFEYVLNLGGYVEHSNFSDGGFNVVETNLNGVINLIKIIEFIKCEVKMS